MLDLDSTDGLQKVSGRIWIPTGSSELKLKLIVCAHCGIGGHRGVEATMSILSERFVWTGLKQDVEAFVVGCLHCIVSRTGSIIPRPLAHSMHASKPNEILHLDYLYMGTGVGEQKYCLILKDDFSS